MRITDQLPIFGGWFFILHKTERMDNVAETNKAKEYLLQVSRAEHRIKRLQEEIQTLQELVTSTSAISQGERVISSTSQDKMADTICTIEERIEEILSIKKVGRDST